ncbi:MAG TPA: hypothetical protein VE443_11735 [Beijerinckiaceae bacterium]|jgi:hypothetical protein|nr:hypothetical protein [Microvirga sp.]HZB38653.1 hypothetical protein [Beijerinckiaceae bacterium]
MDKMDGKPAGPTPIYLDNVRRYIGARLRAALAPYEGQPLPNEHVELILRLRQLERERRLR